MSQKTGTLSRSVITGFVIFAILLVAAFAVFVENPHDSDELYYPAIMFSFIVAAILLLFLSALWLDFFSTAVAVALAFLLMLLGCIAFAVIFLFPNIEAKPAMLPTIKGQGSLASPAGAFISDPSLTGEVEVRLDIAEKQSRRLTEFDLRLHQKRIELISYDSRISGSNRDPAKAVLIEGHGTMSAGPPEGAKGAEYRLYLLETAGQGLDGPDLLRLMIWDEGKNLIYDSGVTTGGTGLIALERGDFTFREYEYGPFDL